MANMANIFDSNSWTPELIKQLDFDKIMKDLASQAESEDFSEYLRKTAREATGAAALRVGLLQQTLQHYLTKQQKLKAMARKLGRMVRKQNTGETDFLTSLLASPSLDKFDEFLGKWEEHKYPILAALASLGALGLLVRRPKPATTKFSAKTLLPALALAGGGGLLGAKLASSNKKKEKKNAGFKELVKIAEAIETSQALEELYNILVDELNLDEEQAAKLHDILASYLANVINTQ